LHPQKTGVILIFFYHSQHPLFSQTVSGVLLDSTHQVKLCVSVTKMPDTTARKKREAKFKITERFSINEIPTY